jgi:hypothetical protein
MQFENATGLAAQMFRGEPEPDIMLATVVAKATYRITGTLELEEAGAAKVQAEDTETPLGTLPFDQVPMKEAADVFVLGNAYAPGSRPTRTMEVALRIGGFERRLVIFGDRQWTAQLTVGEPKPFLTMPITYANAFGGRAEMSGSLVPYADNPFGKGFVLEKDRAAGLTLPNIESPKHLIRSWADQPPPAGFGPVPRQSAINLRRGVRIIDTATGEFEYLMGMYSSAHPDMVVPALEAGTHCALHGMTPEGVLSFRLAALRLSAQVRLEGRESRFPLRVDTMCVLPEERRLVLTARASFRYRIVAQQRREARLVWEGLPSDVGSYPHLRSLP